MKNLPPDNIVSHKGRILCVRVCVFVHSNRITGREAKADTALIRSRCRFVLFADQPPPPPVPKTNGRKSISLPPIPARLEEFHSLHALVQKMSLKPAQARRAQGAQLPKNSNTTSVTISSAEEKRDSKEITAPTVLNWVIVCFSGRRNLMQKQNKLACRSIGNLTVIDRIDLTPFPKDDSVCVLQCVQLNVPSDETHGPPPSMPISI